jgi:hypothetical protein
MVWYFAYGSDLHRHALADFCKLAGRPIPRREEVRPAVLPNHRLAFSSFDPVWNGGAADILRAPGKSVSGLLMQLSPHGLETLDRLAGRTHDRSNRETGRRRRMKVKVSAYGTEPAIEAIAYQVVHPDDHHIPPTRQYMDRLIEAAVESGLSTMWVMYLRSFAVREPAVRYVPPELPMVAPPRFVRRFVERVPFVAQRPRRELELAGTN